MRFSIALAALGLVCGSEAWKLKGQKVDEAALGKRQSTPPAYQAHTIQQPVRFHCILFLHNEFNLSRKP